jgi:hypothetical protein
MSFAFLEDTARLPNAVNYIATKTARSFLEFHRVSHVVLLSITVFSPTSTLVLAFAFAFHFRAHNFIIFFQKQQDIPVVK